MPLTTHKILRPELFTAAHLAFLYSEALKEAPYPAQVTGVDLMEWVLTRLVNEGVLGLES